MPITKIKPSGSHELIIDRNSDKAICRKPIFIQRISDVGEEEVTVGAGTFDALHFRFVGTPGLPQEHPPYDVC